MLYTEHWSTTCLSAEEHGALTGSDPLTISHPLFNPPPYSLSSHPTPLHRQLQLLAYQSALLSTNPRAMCVGQRSAYLRFRGHPMRSAESRELKRRPGMNRQKHSCQSGLAVLPGSLLPCL
ncbi:hypothetical protein BaRGS_00010684 [Batillaria attramentaria]|uniref:Uncharacterized protein n=1 Tax=Batillaria attramentaria TaxID=370345 RepID=A0ABD0LFE9_9CAEN